MGRSTTQSKQIKLNSIIHIGKNEVKVAIEKDQIADIANALASILIGTLGEKLGETFYSDLREENNWKQWINFAEGEATKRAYEKFKNNPDPKIISKGTFDITYENEDFDEIIKKLKPLDGMKAMLLNIQRESDNNTLELRKLKSMFIRMYDCMQRIENLYKRKGVDQDTLKDLIRYGFAAAENRDKELEILIQKVTDRQDDIAEIIGGLDKNILGRLYGRLEDLNCKSAVEDINKTLVAYKEEFQKSSASISDNIDRLSKQIGSTGVEIITTIKETVITRESMEELLNAQSEKEKEWYLEKFRQQQTEIEEIKNMLQNGANKEAEEKLEKQIKYYKEVEKQLKEEIGNLKLNGQHLTQACPICKAVEDRMVVAGQCLCSVCGHEFKELDPTGKNNIDTEEGEQWRKDHAATLELVAPIDAKYKLYRMKISGDHTVSNNNCLIIPNKTYDNNEIKNIDFCQPNTNDKLSRERYGSVKTLFLTQGINVKNGWRNEQYPFSDMQNLERIMVWKDKDNGYVEDNELLEKIKKGQT